MVVFHNIVVGRLKMQKILFLGIVLVAILVISGCCGKPDYQPGNTETNIDESTDIETEESGDDFENIKILSHELSSDGNEYFTTYTVEGTAKNTGDTRVNYAQIDVRFYDTNDVLIGNGMDNAADIDPSVTFKFSVMYLGDDEIDDYDISISGYSY